MQLQTGSTVKKKERHWTFIKIVYRNSRNTSSKRAFFTSSLVRTSKVHSLYSLMIARGSYEYKATSSHCDLTLGGQAAFWVSVELLKARGHIGGGGTSVCYILLYSPASLHPSTFPQLLPGLTAALIARCACRYVRKQNSTTLPVCMRTGGSPPPQFSFQNISESFLSHR